MYVWQYDCWQLRLWGVAPLGPRYIISSSSSRVLTFFCATLLVCTFFRETGRVSAGFFL